MTTEGASEKDASCRISVYDAATQVKIYEDESSLPITFDKQVQYKGASHFMYDLNFDGNMEFFWRVHMAARWQGFEVYVFDSGRIRKVALEFSDIFVDAVQKNIICTISTGVASYFKVVLKYHDGVMETLSSKELTVEPDQ